MQYEVISTDLDLDGPHQDEKKYPWLKDKWRRYVLAEELGSGAFATAYKAFPCDKYGNINSQIAFIVKIPKINSDYSEQENLARLNYIQHNIISQFSHVRSRLLNSQYASPYIDILILPVADFHMMATVQPYLSNAINLDMWLLQNHLRVHPAQRDDVGNLTDYWTGIPDIKGWASVALKIARSVKDIHFNRVIHGDIHPDNIFLTREEPFQAILIDFDKAFTETPDMIWHEKRPRPYLAPEWFDRSVKLSEKVDIYSFGKLLLYLATGMEKIIPHDWYPQTRRSSLLSALSAKPSGVTSLIKSETLISQNAPRILVLIDQCIDMDPANRPNMTDICNYLEEILASTEPDYSPEQQSFPEKLDSLSPSDQHSNNSTTILAPQMDTSLRQRLLEALQEIGGTEQSINIWMNTPNPDLDQFTPWNLIKQGEAQTVLELLEDIARGQPG